MIKDCFDHISLSCARSFVLFLALLLFSINALSYVQNCTQCHADEVSAWQTSHHAEAMALATKEKVLGDFSDTKVPYGEGVARFYQKDEKYLIEFTEGANNTLYEAVYTFGFYPLQQYLVPTGDGKFQVFPLAWDSRAATDGGQRWYPVLSDEEVKEEPRLHWQMPLQNWNGMCADCHSDGLIRNYQPTTNSFETHWDNINVGCQSCHGEMPNHPRHDLPKHNDGNHKSLDVDNKDNDQLTEMVSWVLSEGEPIAQLRNKKGELAKDKDKKARQAFMDTCFACHSLRAPLTDGFVHNMPFLDQFMPTLISSPLYHPDGQINEEVYVYGSFLQSKMFEAGVTCLDCHDAHTMQVKTQTNGLCLQCHSVEKYQQTTHTHHDLASDAGQCVSCHMPATTYMGVDARRDHSFKVPSPSLSTKYNTPNACIDCHNEKSNEWAAKHVTKWFPNSQKPTPKEKQLIDLFAGKPITLQQHLALVEDQGLSNIERASTLALLPNTVSQIDDNAIRRWVASEDALIRYAAAQIGNLLPPIERQKSYLSLLNDKYRAIRVAAAEHLLELSSVNDEVTKSAKRAFDEHRLSNSISSWRGEGALNQSISQLKQSNIKEAIDRLQHGINIDPYFGPSYVNLLDMYRMENDAEEEKALYELAFKRLDHYAPLHYSYGLYQIRTKNIKNAVLALNKAVELAPEDPQYFYVLILAIDSMGNTEQALQKLKASVSKYGSRDLVELGLSLSRKQRDQESFDFFRSQL